MKNFATLPGMLSMVLNHYRNTYAFNYRVNDAWKSISTEHFLEEIRRLVLGLNAQGLRPGEKVALYAPSSPHWMMMDLAIQVAGGVTVPIFAEISDQHLAHILKDAEVSMAFVEGESRLQKLQPHWDNLRRLVTRDVDCKVKHAIHYEAVLIEGDRASQDDPEAFVHLRDDVQPHDTATIIYTSGSTGNPKGVVLSHANLVSQIHATAQRFDMKPNVDKVLSCLPLAHIFERMVMLFYISRGVSIYFADDVQKVGPYLQEIHPTAITMVPRILEKVYAKLEKKLDEANTVGRTIGRWAMKVAKEETDDGFSLSRFVADKMVLHKLRESLGDNLRWIIVGGAKLDPGLCQFMINAGLPVYQGYGMTECSPVIAANCEGHNRVGSVGQLYPGVQVSIGERDEILVKGPGVMQGYFNALGLIKGGIDDAGWLHTGDCGYLDDEGYLFITGRLKDLCKTSTGKYVSPTHLEQALCRHPAIDMAMVVAEGRKFVSALLFPEADAFDELKQACSISPDRTVLLNDPQIAAFVAEVLGQANDGLNPWEEIKQAAIVCEAPTIDNNMLTPTMKLRRFMIEDTYQETIEAMYAAGNAPADAGEGGAHG